MQEFVVGIMRCGEVLVLRLPYNARWICIYNEDRGTVLDASLARVLVPRRLPCTER